MLSGHRHKAAFTMLSVNNHRYDKMPCRVAVFISDAQALTLPHTANLFTRQLSVTERAAANRTLGVEVERLRESHPELRGQRTEDIKASIVSQQTGRKVSGKTIQRQEDVAGRAAALGPGWQKVANRELLSDDALRALENMDPTEAEGLYKTTSASGITKHEVTALITSASNLDTDKPNANLVRAERALAEYVSGQNFPSAPPFKRVVCSLGITQRIAGQRLKTLAFTFVQAVVPLSLSQPLKAAVYLALS